MPSRRWRHVLWTIPVAAMAALYLYSTSGCTLRGCFNTFVIELDTTQLAVSETYDIEVCIDGRCTREVLTHTGTTPDPSSHTTSDGSTLWYALPDREYRRRPEVSVRIVTAGGDVLVDSTQRVAIDRDYLNGWRCTPCYRAEMRV